MSVTKEFLQPIIATSITAGNLAVNTAITTANIAVGALTAGNLRVPGTLTVTNISVNNLVQSSGSIVVTGNSNTIGNIFTTGGNVGVGTTAPAGGLNINMGSTNTMAVRVDSNGAGWGSGIAFYNSATSGNNYGIYSGSDGLLHVSDINRSLDRIIINTSGNIGISTVAPTHLLEVNGPIKSLNLNNGVITSVKTSIHRFVATNIWTYTGEYITITVPSGPSRWYRVVLSQLVQNSSGSAGQIQFTLQTQTSGVTANIFPYIHALSLSGIWVSCTGESQFLLAPGTYTYYVMSVASVSSSFSVANNTTDSIYSYLHAYPM